MLGLEDIWRDRGTAPERREAVLGGGKPQKCERLGKLADQLPFLNKDAGSIK